MGQRVRRWLIGISFGFFCRLVPSLATDITNIIECETQQDFTVFSLDYASSPLLQSQSLSLSYHEWGSLNKPTFGRFHLK